MSNEFKPESLQQIIAFADSISSIKREGIPEKLFDLCLHHPGVAKLLAIGARAELFSQSHKEEFAELKKKSDEMAKYIASHQPLSDPQWKTGSSCTI